MKKPSVVSFLITLMLAAAVCIQGQEPVKDTDNNPVEIGQKYLIVPVPGLSNGENGLLPFPIHINPFCPFGIFQGVFPNNSGIPISFKYPFIPETIVKTFNDVAIEFKPNFRFCEKFSKFWEVNETASLEPPILVAGNPENQNSWFQISYEGEDAEGENIYKLKTYHGAVGTKPAAHLLNGRELVLTNDYAKTLLVKFKKVATPASPPTSQVEKFGLRMFPLY